MKRNGTRSNQSENPPILFGRRAGDQASPAGTEDAAADYFPAAMTQGRDTKPAPLAPVSRQTLSLVVVSVACATAALVAGSYAIWLTRRQAAQNALTDVRDLLRTCQDRMVQMEDELHRLPPPSSASPSSR